MKINARLRTLAVACCALGFSPFVLAVPITLDLTSGTDSILNGAPVSFDTYDEDGFRLQMDRAGDHIDRNFIGDLGFHNGPANPDNISWTLSFGGNAFSLIDVLIASFANSALSITLTGSNSVSQTLSAVGVNAISGMGNVTFVTFNIDQDGGIESVGLNEINVDSTPVATPEPGALGLVGLGLVAIAALRRRRAMA